MSVCMLKGGCLAEGQCVAGRQCMANLHESNTLSTQCTLVIPVHEVSPLHSEAIQCRACEDLLAFSALVKEEIFLMWCVSCAVEEATITLVRLYQHFTFRLSETCAEPLDLRQAITMAPKNGVPVYVTHRAQA